MHLDLNSIWYILVGVLFTGYAMLDGFDLGIGALHLFTRKDEERRVMLNSIGPVWDGNEVWLVTGGGALFAAFPTYLRRSSPAFTWRSLLLLVALIFRAVAISSAAAPSEPWWRQMWDVGFAAGSVLVEPALFINMMSGETSLFADGRSQSDIRQGVTLEIFGEGESMGPLNDAMRAEYENQEADFHYDVTWHTLAEGLDTLAHRGISTNIASFIGAATPRVNVLGRANRAPTAAELDQMRALTAKAMQDGALGVASALIYQPGVYAKTDELIALAQVAAQYHGIYISHMRNEGDHELEAIDELITIARQAKIPAEIYHLKVSGEKNWGNLPR